MLDLEQGSLNYFATRAVTPQWSGFLQGLATELAAQMGADELRSFFRVVGRRWARQQPLQAAASLAELEQAANLWFANNDWGWVRVRDLQSALEFQHSCAPLRQAFGADSIHWTAGVLEGLYDEWVRQLGAGEGLIVRHVGRVEGLMDTLRFRLAVPEHFS